MSFGIVDILGMAATTAASIYGTPAAGAAVGAAFAGGKTALQGGTAQQALMAAGTSGAMGAAGGAAGAAGGALGEAAGGQTGQVIGDAAGHVAFNAGVGAMQGKSAQQIAEEQAMGLAGRGVTGGITALANQPTSVDLPRAGAARGGQISPSLYGPNYSYAGGGRIGFVDGGTATDHASEGSTGQKDGNPDNDPGLGGSGWGGGLSTDPGMGNGPGMGESGGSESSNNPYSYDPGPPKAPAVAPPAEVAAPKPAPVVYAPAPASKHSDLLEFWNKSDGSGKIPFSGSPAAFGGVAPYGGGVSFGGVAPVGGESMRTAAADQAAAQSAAIGQTWGQPGGGSGWTEAVSGVPRPDMPMLSDILEPEKVVYAEPARRGWAAGGRIGYDGEDGSYVFDDFYNQIPTVDTAPPPYVAPSWSDANLNNPSLTSTDSYASADPKAGTVNLPSATPRNAPAPYAVYEGVDNTVRLPAQSGASYAATMPVAPPSAVTTANSLPARTPVVVAGGSNGAIGGATTAGAAGAAGAGGTKPADTTKPTDATKPADAKKEPDWFDRNKSWVAPAGAVGLAALGTLGAMLTSKKGGGKKTSAQLQAEHPKVGAPAGYQVVAPPAGYRPGFDPEWNYFPNRVYAGGGRVGYADGGGVENRRLRQLESLQHHRNVFPNHRYLPVVSGNDLLDTNAGDDTNRIYENSVRIGVPDATDTAIYDRRIAASETNGDDPALWRRARIQALAGNAEINRDARNADDSRLGYAAGGRPNMAMQIRPVMSAIPPMPHRIGPHGYAKGGGITSLPGALPMGPGGDEQAIHGRRIMDAAEAALNNQHPNPQDAIGRFRQHFGDDALQTLMEKARRGDGMSDSLPATIDGRREAALASGEYVIPADIVSHLGNGNSGAGARELDLMNARVRKARTGNSKQAPALKAGGYLPA